MHNSKASTTTETPTPARVTSPEGFSLPAEWPAILRAIVGGGPATPAECNEPVPVATVRARLQDRATTFEDCRLLAVAALLSFHGSGESLTVALSPRGARRLLEHETAGARAAMIPTSEPEPSCEWIMLAHQSPAELEKSMRRVERDGWRAHNVTPGRSGSLYIMHMMR